MFEKRGKTRKMELVSVHRVDGMEKSLRRVDCKGKSIACATIRSQLMRVKSAQESMWSVLWSPRSMQSD